MTKSRTPRQNPEPLQNLLAASPLGVAVISVESGDCLYVNPRLSALFGPAFANTLMAPGLKDCLVSPASATRLQDRLRSGDIPDDFKIQGRRRDGSVWSALLSAQAIAYEGQQAQAIWFTDISAMMATRDLGDPKTADLSATLRARDRALRETEEKLDMFSKLASAWLWEMGPDLCFTYMSKRVEAQTGVAVSFHIGKSRADLAGEDATSDKWQAHLRDLEAHKPFDDFRYHRKGPKGNLQYLSASGRPVFDAQGVFQGYIGIGSDITEQIVAVDQAKIARERLAAAIYAFSEPFVLWDPQDRLQIGNNAFQEINRALGTKAEPGVTYAEFARSLAGLGLIPEAVGREEAWLKQRLAQHQNPSGPFEQKRADGKWFLMYEQRFADGSTVTISTEITELKRTEARLKDSQARFRDYAEVAAEWYWELDENLQFTAMNTDNMPFMGMPAQDYVGKSPWEVGLTDVAEAEMQAHKKQLQAHEPFSNFRASRPGPNTDKIYISISGKPIFDADGRFTGYRGSGRDITDIVEAQRAVIEERDRAERANRAKSEFLANMSHELRTPLNSILGYSQMIRDQMVGKIENPKYPEYANDIYSSGQHLLLVISDILDISKVEAGEITIEETPLDFNETVTATLLIVELLGKSKQQAIDVDMDPDLPRLHADERLVRQIMINLLSNAIKFTPDGGRITISAEITEDGRFQAQVTDTGIGIAEKDIQIALEPFGQVRMSPELAHEGTGLGLSLSKSLVELHGGTLSIQSELGKGTTVTLIFPKERLVPAAS